ncbi:hypothetical protein CGZ93_03970 [Enemella dayhoffiae]|uniref:Alpha-tubulin suppressor n=1 Tax=Enemella dayhoffiae TaxID=2016507 RepID=A0A255H923_9ACTN|nr:hypothetical protein [Enemella dayhoffiae]OYO24270.1 hypothetical protein CGZ93_03970 [Enemella dayhoffiae]
MHRRNFLTLSIGGAIAMGLSACGSATSILPGSAKTVSGTVWNEIGPTKLTKISSIVCNADKSKGTVNHLLDADKKLWLSTAKGGNMGDAAPVPGLPGLTQVASQGYSPETFVNIALADNGTVWAWGMAHGVTDKLETAPVEVPNVKDLTAVAVGPSGAVLAITKDGGVLAWGRQDDYLTLGIPVTKGESVKPTPLRQLSEVVSLDTDGAAAFAVTRSGKVFGWGTNNHGRLNPDEKGYGSKVPVELPLPALTAVSASNFATVGLRSDGSMLGWGSGGAGMGPSSNKAVPLSQAITKTGPVKFTQVRCYGDWSAGLGEDGKVYGIQTSSHEIPDGRGGYLKEERELLPLSWIEGKVITLGAGNTFSCIVA